MRIASCITVLIRDRARGGPGGSATTAVEDVLLLRERTFMARTASAGGMQVPGRSRRWENAVLG